MWNFGGVKTLSTVVKWMSWQDKANKSAHTSSNGEGGSKSKQPPEVRCKLYIQNHCKVHKKSLTKIHQTSSSNKKLHKKNPKIRNRKKKKNTPPPPSSQAPKKPLPKVPRVLPPQRWLLACGLARWVLDDWYTLKRKISEMLVPIHFQRRFLASFREGNFWHMYRWSFVRYNW